jgi:hypothetical protein
MPKVDFTHGNLKKCRCGVCPVQAGSACVKVQNEMIKQEMGDPAAPSLPNPQNTPGVYCSHGKASCKDLDPSQSCICPTCAVWSENKLTATYYCQNGSAQEIG